MNVQPTLWEWDAPRGFLAATLPDRVPSLLGARNEDRCQASVHSRKVRKERCRRYTQLVFPFSEMASNLVRAQRSAVCSQPCLLRTVALHAARCKGRCRPLTILEAGTHLGDCALRLSRQRGFPILVDR